jgi:hypothetical protein
MRLYRKVLQIDGDQRAEPRPTGGGILGMMMDDELPILHWLLREQVAEVFQVLAQNHHDQLREFVCWFLERARRYTEYFSGSHRYSSFNMYAFGRPRFAAWVRLAQEVQDAAVSLGVSIPAELRLRLMPALNEPTRAVLIESPVRISGRRLKQIQNAFFGAASEGRDRKS